MVINKVEYFIFWEQMSIGASFFLPTTATATQVMLRLKRRAQHLRITLRAQPRREYGRYGVRVWRMG